MLVASTSMDHLIRIAFLRTIFKSIMFYSLIFPHLMNETEPTNGLIQPTTQLLLITFYYFK